MVVQGRFIKVGVVVALFVATVVGAGLYPTSAIAARPLMPEKCLPHTHRVPVNFTFNTVGINQQYGWLRLERSVCFNNQRVTRVTQTQTFLDLPDAVRVLNIVSYRQLRFEGSYEPWDGNTYGQLNSFYEASVRVSTGGVTIPRFTIPYTKTSVGPITLRGYNGEVERPAIRIRSLANGCYYAAPSGGSTPICPAGAYN